MIKLDLSTALFVYLFFTVIAVLLLWLVMDLGTKLKTYSSDEKFIWHCNICANTYIDSRHEAISKCPRCGSFIEK
ncbi:MAG: hypothetical protein HQL30_01475 [Candidatus Omnitrophica bacterium]|nr:hypothetical protein [Candidatus Omnitrophota bacterium]